MAGRQVTAARSRLGVSAGVRLPRHLGITLLALAALGYCGWVLEFFLAGELPVWQSYVGELSADTSPHQSLFRTVDFVTGALALVASPFLARLAPAQTAARLTVLSVAVFGILMLLRASFTLDCAPSVSTMCTLRQETGAVSASHQIRRLLTAVISVHFLLGVATAERWFPRGFWRNGLRAAWLLAALCGTAIIVLDSLGPGHYVGIAVRGEMVIQAATLFFGAVYLFDTYRLPGRRERSVRLTPRIGHR